jgi:hypothetical protein
MSMYVPTIGFVAMAFALAPMCAADCCENSVAVVASLSGSATVRSPGAHEEVPVSSFDWISEGATLQVGRGSKAVIILSNGHRYELLQDTQATITASQPSNITGVVRELAALPPIPKPAPIAGDSASTPGSVRMRGLAGISDLYPSAGTYALPDRLTLRFKAVPDATSYRVVLEGDGGDKLLNVTTQSTEVKVPSGTMEAGAHYSWHVRAMRSGMAIGVGTAEFDTLSAENALQRAEFASALGATGSNPAALGLLGEVDLRLGLVAEACEEFSAALELKPGDIALRRGLDSARAVLAEKSK